MLICYNIINKRFIPLSTLLMASAINVPITRNNEIIHGVAIYGCNKEKIGYSKVIFFLYKVYWCIKLYFYYKSNIICFIRMKIVLVLL